MTKQEAMRLTHQENVLMSPRFTQDEANKLRHRVCRMTTPTASQSTSDHKGNDMNVIAYPNFIAQIGGAKLVRHNGRFAWVELIGKTIRLPLRELQHSLDDGCKVAEIARTYAYRNH